MGIANRIINILVLLAAVAAIVLGIMLFNKREDIALSRQKMADAIAESSNKLIATADKKQKDELTVSADNMAMNMTSDNVEGEVTKLKKVTDVILKHQETIAKNYADTVKDLTDGQCEPNVKKIVGIKDRETEVKDIEGAVARHNEKIEKTRNSMKNAITAIGSSLNVEKAKETANLDLTDAANVDEFDKIVNAVDAKGKKYVAALALMTEHVKTVQTSLEKDELLVNVDTEDAKVKLEEQAVTVATKVEELKAKIQECIELTQEKEKLTAENDQLNKDKQKLTEEKENLVAEAKKLNETINKQKKEIVELKKKNDQRGVVAGKQAAPRLVPGAKNNQENAGLDNNELLKKVQGKILSVDLESGVVLLDVGSKTQVEIKDAKGKVSKVPVTIGQNVIMTVVSSNDPATAKFLGKIQIIRLEEKNAIANILPSPGNLNPVIGSIVYFSEQDFAAMRERNLKAMEAEQKAAAAAEVKAEAEGDVESSADILNDSEEEAAPAEKAASADDKKVDATASDEVF